MVLRKIASGQITSVAHDSPWGVGPKAHRVAPVVRPLDERTRILPVWTPMAAKTQFHFREHWHQLRQGRPGRRFQETYDRTRAEGRAGAAERIVLAVIAVVFLAIGVVLSVIPGPALPFFFVGGGLLATESRLAARFMDWSEVKVRQVFAWGKRRWSRLPVPGRIAVSIFATCCSAATAYLGYRLLHG
jgi:hypothetical protein